MSPMVPELRKKKRDQIMKVSHSPIRNRAEKEVEQIFSPSLVKGKASEEL